MKVAAAGWSWRVRSRTRWLTGGAAARASEAAAESAGLCLTRERVEEHGRQSRAHRHDGQPVAATGQHLGGALPASAPEEFQRAHFVDDQQVGIQGVALAEPPVRPVDCLRVEVPGQHGAGSPGRGAGALGWGLIAVRVVELAQQAPLAGAGVSHASPAPAPRMTVRQAEQSGHTEVPSSGEGCRHAAQCCLAAAGCTAQHQQRRRREPEARGPTRQRGVRLGLGSGLRLGLRLGY